jgi:exopolyphosphatase/guanosine-5'-triphosphate,3'-diphosphate pyrophosphatase
MRLAAIDIGSNAARLLITDVTPDEKGGANFDKMNLVRVPLRLGLMCLSGDLYPNRRSA